MICTSFRIPTKSSTSIPVLTEARAEATRSCRVMFHVCGKSLEWTLSSEVAITDRSFVNDTKTKVQVGKLNSRITIDSKKKNCREKSA